MKRTARKIVNTAQGYIQTDIMYLLRGGSWLSLGFVFSAIASLAMMIAFANLLPQAEYGIYRFLISGMGIIGAISLTGLTDALTRAISRGKEGTFRLGVKMLARWSTIPCVLGLGVSGYYAINDNMVLAGGFLLIAILFPLAQVWNLGEAIVIGKKLFKKKSLINIVQNILIALGIITSLFLTDNVLVLLGAYLGATVVGSMIMYAFVRRHVRDDADVDEELFQNSKQLTIVNTIIRLGEELDKVVVFHFLGAVQLAIYSFGLSPVKRLESLKLVVRNLIFPKVSVQDIDLLKKTLPRKMLLLALGALLIAAIYIALAPWLFALVFPEYMDSVVFSQVLALLLVLAGPILVMTQTFVAHMKVRELYITRTITPVIKIVLVVVLVPLFGIWGAVFAVLGSQVVNAAALGILFTRIS